MVAEFSRVETREVCALPAVHRLNPMTKRIKEFHCSLVFGLKYVFLINKDRCFYETPYFTFGKCMLNL